MLYQTQNPHGGDVYGTPVRMDFSANINPYGTPPGVLAAIRATLPDLRHYPDPYCRKLVQAIAAFERVPAAFVLCGNGAAELIYSYAAALRPRTALLPAPTFSEYAQGLQRCGCTVQYHVLSQENDFAIGEDFLAAIEQARPDAVFLCNPNNPTGRTADPTLLRRLPALCGRLHIHLFLDECFLDLSEHGESLVPLLAEHPQLFVLKAFTKSYGMAGLRLGYGLCADPALLRAMAQTVQPWNVSLPAQASGVAALQEQGFLQTARQTIFAEKPWLAAQLRALGMQVCPSDANYLLFRGPIGLHTALLARGIAIRNCANYPGLCPGWYRIAVRLHPENQQLIAAIAAAKEELWPAT